jgi:hypothetical protein
MREAPLNVGMIIDTDLDSMGHPSFCGQQQKRSPGGYARTMPWTRSANEPSLGSLTHSVSEQTRTALITALMTWG